MNELQRISEAEWTIMEILWTQAPKTSTDIIRIAQEQHAWSPKTVRTLVERLVKKNALRRKEGAQGLLFEPAVPREHCVQKETQGFVARVFAGMPVPFLSRFIDSNKLTKSDLAELKAFIERKEKELQNHD